MTVAGFQTDSVQYSTPLLSYGLTKAINRIRLGTWEGDTFPVAARLLTGSGQAVRQRLPLLPPTRAVASLFISLALSPVQSFDWHA